MSHLFLKTVFGVVAGVSVSVFSVHQQNENYRDVKQAVEDAGYDYKGARHLGLAEASVIYFEAKNRKTGEIVHGTAQENGLGYVKTSTLHFSKP